MNNQPNFMELFSRLKNQTSLPSMAWGGTGKKILALLVLAGILFVFLLNFFFVYIEPDEFGIKVNRVGLSRGVQEKAYHAGYWFVFPFGLQKCTPYPRAFKYWN